MILLGSPDMNGVVKVLTVWEESDNGCEFLLSVI
jgi:hypothetical protein